MNAQMTARLFCEGSGRDKQIAQESSFHKDGRTEPECHAAGHRKRCKEIPEALQGNTGSAARKHRHRERC